MKPELWELVVAVLGILATWGLRTLAAKRAAGDVLGELEHAAGIAAQRAKDKFLADLIAARDPSSDGGLIVTPKEMSDARAHAFSVLLGSATGPLLDLVKAKGPDFIKGLLGQKLDALVNPTLVEAPPAGGS